MTRRTAALIVPLLALTLSIGSAARGTDDDANQPGSLTGTVVDSNGQAAANVAVRLYAEPKIERSHEGGGGNRRNGKRQSIEGVPQPITLAAGELTTQTTTDAQGKYTVGSLAPGTYTYRVGDPSTVGYAAGKVTIEAGKAMTLDVHLKPPVRG